MTSRALARLLVLVLALSASACAAPATGLLLDVLLPEGTVAHALEVRILVGGALRATQQVSGPEGRALQPGDSVAFLFEPGDVGPVIRVEAGASEGATVVAQGGLEIVLQPERILRVPLTLVAVPSLCTGDAGCGPGQACLPDGRCGPAGRCPAPEQWTDGEDLTLAPGGATYGLVALPRDDGTTLLAWTAAGNLQLALLDAAGAVQPLPPPLDAAPGAFELWGAIDAAGTVGLVYTFYAPGASTLGLGYVALDASGVRRAGPVELARAPQLGNPAMAAGPAGFGVAWWESTSPAAQAGDLRFLSVDADGVPAGAPTTVVATPYANAVRIAASPAGHFLLAASEPGDPSSPVLLLLVDAAGRRVELEGIRAELRLGSLAAANVDVASLPDGGYGVVWIDFRDLEAGVLNLARLGPDLSLLGSTALDATLFGDGRAPRLLVRDQELALAYASRPRDQSGSPGQMRLAIGQLDGAGALVEPEITEVSDLAGMPRPRGPTALGRHASGVVVGWVDDSGTESFDLPRVDRVGCR